MRYRRLSVSIHITISIYFSSQIYLSSLCHCSFRHHSIFSIHWCHCTFCPRVSPLCFDNIKLLQFAQCNSTSYKQACMCMWSGRDGKAFKSYISSYDSVEIRCSCFGVQCSFTMQIESNREPFCQFLNEKKLKFELKSVFLIWLST